MSLSAIGMALLLVGTGPALDSEPTPVVDLRWHAPPGCPSEEEVRARIVELVGEPLGQDPTRTLVVEGTIAASPRGFRLELALAQPDGTTATRELEASNCQELGGPAAVVVSIAVVAPSVAGAAAVPLPPLTRAKPEREPAQPVRQPAAASAPIDDPVAVGPTALSSSPAAAGLESTRPNATPRPRRRRRGLPRVALGVGGGLAGANLPSVGGALQGAVGLLLPRIRIDAIVTHEFRRRLQRGGGGALFDLTAARVEACGRLGRPRLRFPVCAGPELGRVRADGFGVDSPRGVRQLWFALVGGAGVAWAPKPVIALRLRTELVVAPVRREFTLDGATLFATRIFGARAIAGLEVRLP